MAYLGRQVRTMIWFVILITIGLYLMYQSLPDQYPHPLPIGVAVAFLMGVMASHGAGYVGMWLAVKANLRAANAALKGFKPALELAFRAGTVSGMFTVGFGLLGAVLIFMIFREDAMKVLVASALGGRWPLSLCGWAEGSSRKRPTSAPTWLARSSKTSRRTIHATLR